MALAQGSRLKAEGEGPQPPAPSPQRSSIDRFGVDWQGRTVLVVGLGKSGAAACRLLRQIGCDVRATDASKSESLQSLAHELRASGIDVELGGHTRELFEGCDAVVLSPGVPESAAPVRWALEAQVAVLSEVELAFRLCQAPIVAVTGTNGKSTAVTLLQRILSAAGRASVACGNLGIPCSEVLPWLPADTIAVVEVSSFQLLWCHEFRPLIGVLLNLGVNHLDRHPDRAHYIAAKARLFQRQTPQDYAVLNGKDPLVLALSERVLAQRVWFAIPNNYAPAWHLEPETCRVLEDNVQAVLQAARLLQVPDPLSYQVIREFRGLEHRLEPVATVRGVQVINDSKSTTPESLLYALDRCAGTVVPIIGGRDKGMDFQPLAQALAQERIRGVVVIGEARARLRSILSGPHPVQECASLDDAVDAALRLAHPGDTVLFSPACASFDMFKNFEDRGETFKRLVRLMT